MTTATADTDEMSPQTRLSIGFLNWAHAADHYVLLIYPTVVIGLEAVYARTYGELIALSTAAFLFRHLLAAGRLAWRSLEPDAT